MQVEHKTEKGVILFVDVPDDSFNFKVSKGYLWFDNNHFKDCCMPALPEHLDMGDWQLIGLTSDVTELQAMNMVDYRSDKDEHQSPIFKDYVTGIFGLEPMPSFKSLMHHKKLYEVNPYGSECPTHGFAHEHEKQFAEILFKAYIDKWQEAQKRTSKRVVLFKPNEK